MSDLVVRYDGKGEVVFYRHQLNQACFMTISEFNTLCNLIRREWGFYTFFAYNVTALETTPAPQEYHRRVIRGHARGVFNCDIQLDLFDCRKIAPTPSCFED